VVKVVAQNRRARFDYEILSTVEAGIVLTGQEVKSCRLGQVNLAGAFVSFRGPHPMIKGLKISAYKYAGTLKDYDPGHDRTLLLKKQDIEKLSRDTEEKGMTVVPLEVRAGKFIKVLIGVARGRKRLDKRQRIREREMGRRLREHDERNV
jgi:SsrA-binding protein